MLPQAGRRKYIPPKDRSIAEEPLCRVWHPVRVITVMAVLLAVTTLLTLMLFTPPSAVQTPPMAVSASAPGEAQTNALPEQITLGLPSGMETCTVSFPMARLLSGHMLLVDNTHPIPADAPAPLTYSLLRETGGRIACRDVNAVCGKDTLMALEALFADARRDRITHLTVFAATRSREQQRQLQTDRFARLARDMSLDEALQQVKRTLPDPGCSEHQLSSVVDIRICTAWNKAPSQAALSASKAGTWLMEHCWRSGFIHRWDAQHPSADPDEAYHFRYVGKAHAAMMRALALPLEAYLTFLHQQETLTLYDDAGEIFATVLCQRAGEAETAFDLPKHGALEDVSFDNMGYAVAAWLY